MRAVQCIQVARREPCGDALVLTLCRQDKVVAHGARVASLGTIAGAVTIHFGGDRAAAFIRPSNARP